MSGPPMRAKDAIDQRLRYQTRRVAVMTFVVGDDDPITIESREHHVGTQWAICNYGLVLSRSGEWVTEPPASQRDRKFLKHHRFGLTEAFKVCGLSVHAIIAGRRISLREDTLDECGGDKGATQ